MFNDVKWGRYKPLNSITREDLSILDSLLRVVFPTASVDFDSEHAKLKLRIGVITLVDGLKVECYPLIDLVVWRLAPMLLGNNHWYLNAFKKQVLRNTNNQMLTDLAHMTIKYYRQFKKQKGWDIPVRR